MFRARQSPWRRSPRAGAQAGCSPHCSEGLRGDASAARARWWSPAPRLRVLHDASPRWGGGERGDSVPPHPPRILARLFPLLPRVLGVSRSRSPPVNKLPASGAGEGEAPVRW